MRLGFAGFIALGLALSSGALAPGCGGSSSTPMPAETPLCTPGASVTCTGPAGCAGFQVCKLDGGGYLRCDCAPGVSDAELEGEGGIIVAGDATTGTDSGRDGDTGTADSATGGGDASQSSTSVAVSESSQSDLESEVQLAVARDGTIAIAWIAVSAGQADSWIGYRFSKDGGATFSPIGRLQIPAGLSGSDPALAVDGGGNFYLAALGVHFAGMNADYTRVFVAKAPSGAMAFATPVDVVGSSQPALYDHPKILVTAKGTVVLGFADVQAPADGGPPTSGIGRVCTSKDGQTWQVGTLPGPPAVQFANLIWFCEGASVLYTTYLEVTSQTAYIALRSSPDDGTTWSANSAEVSLPSELVAQLDPGCVASGNDVWIAYATTATPSTDPTNFLDSARAIRVAHSPDRGSTLDTARIDALDRTASALGLLPVLVRAANGALDVAYLGGAAEGDTKGSVRYVRYTADAGFAASVSVDGPLMFTMNRSMPNWLGDYLGAVASGDKLLVAYPMNTSGTTHIYFRSLAP